ncbi:hypothetical protein AB205_0070810 [Aquarana catesbeiana]|uniref:Uncharacterized protein n=1 Tax=Aquarana catesbeiana TaxID=8400 RepID=A0A2G9SKP8_AQUCT|nr:hypothetical protein AB205_0070810 [Aquarana catesbeiana]
MGTPPGDVLVVEGEAVEPVPSTSAPPPRMLTKERWRKWVTCAPHQVSV